MNCPRCGVPLKTQAYEEVEVDFCDACWGYWLDAGELPAVLKARIFEFSEAERARIRQVLRGEGRKEDAPPADCPRCDERMEAVRVAGTPLYIDRCPTHGTWLDTGELKALQIFNESQAPAALAGQRSLFTRLLSVFRAPE